MNYQIKSKSELKKYYTGKSVVEDYVEKRFTTPLGRVLHKKQVDVINESIFNYNVNKVIEVACGPARITVEILGVEKGVAVDSSKEMLKRANKVMKKSSQEWKKWKFILMDVNTMSKELESGCYDMVYTFRFLRHFKRKDRKKFLSEIRKVLKKDALLIFDAPNVLVEKKVRKIVGNEKYTVYDYFWNRDSVKKELESNGFYNIRLIPNIKLFWIEGGFSKLSSWIGFGGFFTRLIEFLENLSSGNNPYEWIVICQKK